MIALQNRAKRKENGIEDTADERDLTAVDGGLWETYGETPELKAVAAEFMATTTNALVQIKDTEQFLKLCNAESLDEIAGALERLKLDSLPSILDNTEQTETKGNTVEAPAAEEISQTEVDTPAAGIPSAGGAAANAGWIPRCRCAACRGSPAASGHPDTRSAARAAPSAGHTG